MLFELPFWYKAKVIIRGARTPTSVIVLDNIVANVPEFSAADACAVAKIIDVEEKHRTVVDYLSVHGRLVRQMPSRCDFSLDTPPATGFNEAQDALSSWLRGDFSRETAGFVPFPTSELAARPGQRIEHAAHMSACQWLSDTRDEKAAYMRDLFENKAAVVDGSLWVPSFGPAYLIAERWDHRGAELGTRRIVRISVHPELGALRYDRAAAVIPAWRSASIDKYFDTIKMEVSPREAVLVQSTHTVTLKDLDISDIQEPVALRIATEQFVNRFHNQVHKLPNSDLLTYADLREALVSGVSSDILIDLAGKFREALRAARITNSRWSGDSVANYLVLRDEAFADHQALLAPPVR